jgi:hypothetical protein
MDEMPAELVQVRNAVACELSAQLNLRDETIDLAAVCEVAHAIAVRLGHEFRIEPAPPQQEGRPDDDSLGLDAAAFYGSALPAEQYPVFDYRWPSHSE